MATAPRRSRADMGRPKKARGVANLGELAAVQDSSEAAATAYEAPVEHEIEHEDETTAVEEPTTEPEPKRTKASRSSRVVTKNINMHEDWVVKIDEACIDWGTADRERLLHFNGTPSWGAFLQALASFAIDEISTNQRKADKLLKHFPPNARTAHRR